MGHVTRKAKDVHAHFENLIVMQPSNYDNNTTTRLRIRSDLDDEHFAVRWLLRVLHHGCVSLRGTHGVPRRSGKIRFDLGKDKARYLDLPDRYIIRSRDAVPVPGTRVLYQVLPLVKNNCGNFDSYDFLQLNCPSNVQNQISY